MSSSENEVLPTCNRRGITLSNCIGKLFNAIYIIDRKKNFKKAYGSIGGNSLKYKLDQFGIKGQFDKYNNFNL